MKNARRPADYQRSKLYRWEEVYIFPGRFGNKVPLSHAQGMVDYIWSDLGLSHPPKVEVFKSKNTKLLGSADRLCISIPEDGVETLVLLHEIAHSLTSTIDDCNCRHGPRYVGVYINLLHKYAGLDLLMMYHTLSLAGVDFNHKGIVV